MDVEVASDRQQYYMHPKTKHPVLKLSSQRVPNVNYDFRDDPYWHSVCSWKDISRQQFEDPIWQQQNCIKSIRDVARILGDQVDPLVLEDIADGLEIAPMNVRITPYLFAMIDWSNPYGDHIRRQFLPMRSQFLNNHPHCMDDSLGEVADMAAPFLIHRYPDKVLFLPVSVCPVYCLYCTRSRMVGGSTVHKEKVTYGEQKPEWDETFEYILDHPMIEDVVISGGDAFMLRPDTLAYIGGRLLEIPHIRRIRIATKGIGVLPMRITSDDGWTDAVARISDQGRALMKEVCIHTHISTECEMTAWTERAMQRLTSLGVKVRNQCVLMRGVNDDFDTMYHTMKKLAYLNIQPYLVYLHDMVPGCEHLRTTLAAANQMSKELQGTLAGFNTPRFVCDAPNGGGKREIASYEKYDHEMGISAWLAPRVKPGEVFYYFDPIDQLPESGQAIWMDRDERNRRLNAFRRKVDSNYFIEDSRIVVPQSNGLGEEHVVC